MHYRTVLIKISLSQKDETGLYYYYEGVKKYIPNPSIELTIVSNGIADMMLIELANVLRGNKITELQILMKTV